MSIPHQRMFHFIFCLHSHALPAVVALSDTRNWHENGALLEPLWRVVLIGFREVIAFPYLSKAVRLLEVLKRGLVLGRRMCRSIA